MVAYTLCENFNRNSLEVRAFIHNNTKRNADCLEALQYHYHFRRKKGFRNVRWDCSLYELRRNCTVMDSIFPPPAGHDLGLSFLRALSITKSHIGQKPTVTLLLHSDSFVRGCLALEAVPKFQQNFNPHNVLRHPPRRINYHLWHWFELNDINDIHA